MEYLNTKILNYRLTRFIGEGGMASVYEGTHEKLGTKVAIKILNPVLTTNKQIRQRFENEAKMMASLNHPNIIKVLDYDEQPEKLAIVMELLEGQDLKSFINKKGVLTPDQIIPSFIKILDAFQYAHSKGIIHRDIKPSNIFIDDDNQIKVLDFGIAKLFQAGDDFTSTGTQLGTPTYMSPEQVKADKNIDLRSDIYSLGVTLFFLLSGKPPYDSSTQSSFEIFNKIVYEPIPDLKDFPEINSIIKVAVAKDRNQRFPDAKAFKNALMNPVPKATPDVEDKIKVETQKTEP
jgi:serine/threonine protein kinase